MSKLSEAMQTALYRIHDHAWSGANPRTVDALIKRGLLVQKADRPVLTDAGREAIGVGGGADGDFTPENIARAIQEIDSESDEAPVPFLNRQTRREVRRNVARFGRRNMREQGKRIKRFGPHDPMYFRRKHLRMMAETSDIVLASA
jgi:hypothetical protein